MTYEERGWQRNIKNEQGIVNAINWKHKFEFLGSHPRFQNETVFSWDPLVISLNLVLNSELAICIKMED